MIQAAENFVPVFIDTLNDLESTKRFGESYGSYPVLRVHDLEGQEIGGRIDGNLVSGHIPVEQVVNQLTESAAAFQASRQ